MENCVDAYGYGDPKKAFTMKSVELCFKWLQSSQAWCFAKLIGWAFAKEFAEDYVKNRFWDYFCDLDPVKIFFGFLKGELFT